MKKLVLGLSLIYLITTALLAYTVKNSFWSGNTKVYTLICSNGSKTTVSYFQNSDIPYTTGTKGISFKTFDEAAKSACSSNPNNTKIYFLKNEAMVCINRNELKELLSGSGMAYGMHKVNLKYGVKGSSCFLAKSTSKIKILKEYKNETYKQKFDDGKKQWTKTVNLCDTYFKVKSGGNTYYVRKSDIQF